MSGSRFIYGLSVAGAVLLIGVALAPEPGATPLHPPVAATTSALRNRFAHQPLAFEPNVGQSRPGVKYLARGRGYTLLLSATSATLRLTHTAPRPLMIAARGLKPSSYSKPARIVSVRFIGADQSAIVAGVARLRAVSNYLVGRDPSKWHRRVPNYARVRYSSIYPGIDMVYYGAQGKLEFDLVVAPQADPDRIRFAIEGGARPTLNRAGDLVIDRDDHVILRKPLVYQETAAGRRAIDGRFRMLGPSTIGFEVAAYDHRRPLVIDPTVLTYSSYLGGRSAFGRGIAVDSSGGVYVSGWTDLADDLPTRSPNAGGPDQADLNPGGNANGIDTFVAKFDTTMSGDSSLVYSTYLGGGGADEAFAIAVDAAGDAYVTGFTTSSDFPQTNSSVQNSGYGGGPTDAFVSELLPDGSGLVYSTYLGGEGFEIAEGIAVDSSGNAYVAGQTYSLHFPTTASALQQVDPVASQAAEGFLAKLTAASTVGPVAATLGYSTYLAAPTSLTAISGVNISSVTADSAGIAYVAGEAAINFLSGVTGAPTNYGGAGDAIIAAIDTTKSGASSLLYADYLGGSASDGASGIALQPGCTSPCAAYVTGSTISADFPVTAGAADTTFNNTAEDFAAEIQPSGAPLWVTYLGGSLIANATAIAVDTSGRPFIAGATWSPDFPVLNQIQSFGGLSGLMLRSPDDGATFTRLNWPGSTAGSVAVGAIALDTSPSPTNPSVIYAGTVANGVWMSLDGGMNFTQITSSSYLDLPTDQCWGMAYTNLTNPPTLYAGCNNSLYLITNNGASVVKASATNFPVGPIIHSVTVGGASAPDTVYMGTNEGFYVSTDDGGTFTKAKSGLPANTQVWCSVVDQQGDVLVGTNKGLFKSTDGLAALTFAATNLNYFQVNALAADTVSGMVYAGTASGVVASNDEFNSSFIPGLSLAIFGVVNGLAVDYSTSPPSVFAAIDDFTDRAGWIVKSSDQGATFQLVFSGNVFPGFTDALAIDPTTTSPTIYASVAEDSDATVTGLSADGTQIQFSTFLGGPDFDYAEAIALDANDDAFVTGETYGAAFPTTANAFEPAPVSTPAFADAFVTEMPNSMPGTGSTTTLAAGAQLTFSTVTTAGQTSVAQSNSGPALPPGYTLLGTAATSSPQGTAATPPGRTPTAIAATYYDFTTSAVFSGTVLVCIDYNPAQAGDPANVALLHYDGSNWQNVTTSNNPTRGVLCGEVGGFSPFAVATVQSPLTIKIKPPARAPVRIRLRKQGSLPVKIISSPTFDATQIDPSTIRLSGASVKLIRRGTKFACHKVRARHHLKNLVCTTNLGELALARGASLAVLTATTIDGQLVQGAEAVKIVTK